MIELQFEDGDRILWLTYSGVTTASTYVTYMPEVEEAMARVSPRRLLLDWRDVEAWTPESETYAFYGRIQHRGYFERIAVVGDAKWRERAIELDEIVDCEVRFFEPDKEPEAWVWLKGD